MSQIDRTIADGGRSLLVTERGLHKGCECCGSTSPCCDRMPCPPAGTIPGPMYPAMLSGGWSYSSRHSLTSTGETTRLFESGPPPPAVTAVAGSPTECLRCTGFGGTNPSQCGGQEQAPAFCAACTGGAPFSYHSLSLCSLDYPGVGICTESGQSQETGAGAIGISGPPVTRTLNRVFFRVYPENTGALSSNVSVVAAATMGNNGTGTPTVESVVGWLSTGLPFFPFEHLSSSFDITPQRNNNGCCTHLLASWSLSWSQIGVGGGTRHEGDWSGSAMLEVQYGNCGGESEKVRGDSILNRLPDDAVPARLRQGANFGCQGCGG